MQGYWQSLVSTAIFEEVLSLVLLLATREEIAYNEEFLYLGSLLSVCPCMKVGLLPYLRLQLAHTSDRYLTGDAPRLTSFFSSYIPADRDFSDGRRRVQERV